jgi:hypothetical protein
LKEWIQSRRWNSSSLEAFLAMFVLELDTIKIPKNFRFLRKNDLTVVYPAIHLMKKNEEVGHNMSINA